MSVLDWARPLQTKDGRRGELLPATTIETRRRVLFPNRADPKTGLPTVFLFSEEGICRCDGQPGPMDLENVRDLS